MRRLAGRYPTKSVYVRSAARSTLAATPRFVRASLASASGAWPSPVFHGARARPPSRSAPAHARAGARPVRPAGGTLFGRLADRFEGYARALDYTRRVHFATGPS